MPQILVKAGEIRKLPLGVNFETGIGYDDAPNEPEQDLDLVVIRKRTSTVDACFWGKQSWFSKDPKQVTSKGLPWILSPEGDLIHTGDARSGAEKATGYDETCWINPSKAPADTEQYIVLVSNWQDPEQRNPNDPPILDKATNIKFGIKQEGTQNEFVVDLKQDNGFDVTAVLATITKQADGSWGLERVSNGGTQDDLIAVCRAYGVDFNKD